MNVSLTPHFTAFVAEMMESGNYSSASEVIREGLRLLEQKKKEDEARITMLRGALTEAEKSGPSVAWNLKSFLAEAREQYGLPDTDKD